MILRGKSDPRGSKKGQFEKRRGEVVLDDQKSRASET